MNNSDDASTLQNQRGPMPKQLLTYFSLLEHGSKDHGRLQVQVPTPPPRPRAAKRIVDPLAR